MKNLCFTRLVGLVPAAGEATRISPLPCSKELYPVGFRSVDGSRDLRPKVVSHYMFEAMRLAGVTEAFVILRAGKWDVPAYFRDGSMLGMSLAYLVVGPTKGVPFTLDHAHPFVCNATVLLGFPDILFSPQGAFVKTLAKLREGNAEVVLGLFPAHNPRKVDMVELDPRGRVIRMHMKPRDTDLVFTWSVAAWNPTFTDFLHGYVSSPVFEKDKKCGEVFVGDVVQAAVDQGMAVEAVVFDDGKSLDIGTSDDLVRALRRGIQSTDTLRQE